ncbi:MAG: hypothetical protein ACR2RB_17480 [Gammaproteobacteria bacterium]
MNSVVRRILFVMLAAACAPAAAKSPELSERTLCPAELLVVMADVKKYYQTAADQALSRGLKNRIGSALSTLPFVCRRYAQARDLEPALRDDFISRIRKLGTLFDAGDKTGLLAQLQELVRDAPFETAQFSFDREDGQDEREAGDTYRLYCHGCHDATVTASENPAYSLFDMAKNLPRAEFFARMLLGVRGTPDIGLSNPLAPAEIGAMTRFLKSGP